MTPQQKDTEINLLKMHENMSRRRRFNYELTRKLFDDYSMAVKKTCSQLPFKWKIVGASNPSNNHNGISYAADHIVLEEDIAVGRLKRQAGDALCKKLSSFNGNLWVIPYPHSVVTCKSCLKRMIQILDS